MEKILVSACLLGTPCRYDGASKPCPHVQVLAARYELVPVCPECMGGLSTPRPPSERVGDRVVNVLGEDVTEAYRKGAAEVVAIAEAEAPCFALLKARSPACGRGEIYDGTFTKKLCQGNGVAAEMLLHAGVDVYTEEETDALP